VFLCGRGYDVRDVCANRTPRSDRARQREKSDTLDSERIARETLVHPLLPKAFKRAGQDSGPDEHHQLLALWHNRRRSILTSRQHLVNEAEHLLCELPLQLREQLPDSAVRPRLAALTARNRRRRYDTPTRLRLRLLDGYAAQIAALDREEKTVVSELRALVRTSSSTLADSAAWIPGRSPSCWSRSATPDGSPKAGSRGSTAPHRYPRRPLRVPASRSAIVTTPAGTGGSTRSCTGWRSPSCAASRVRRRSSPTPAPTATPRRRPAGSSSATSPTSHRRMIRDLVSDSAQPLPAA
jgi:hypothetical protein